MYMLYMVLHLAGVWFLSQCCTCSIVPYILYICVVSQTFSLVNENRCSKPNIS